MKVLIAGGGIGGMTAALCLAQDGIEVEIFEQAPALGETGAGIQLSANCVRVLHHLGLESEISGISFVPQAVEMRHWRDGGTISETPLGDSALRKYGFPYYHIHRADLMQVLVHAASQLDLIRLHVDLRIDGFDQNEASVFVTTGDIRHTGDVLVGADGIHSIVREGLFGPEQPVFTGNIAWRALVPASALPDDLIRPVATAWWGPRKHFVHYYVRRGELVNCVCVVERKVEKKVGKTVEKTGWQQESWTSRGDHNELKSDFSGWNETVATLIANMDPGSCYQWALFDRPPMKMWSRGRVTLLGDACHPTLPFMAQGAAMAIEDAATLSACLKGIGTGVEDITAALASYENLRKPRTASIQRGSRRNASVFHLTGIKAWLRNRAVKYIGSRLYDSIYSYDVFTALRNR